MKIPLLVSLVVLCVGTTFAEDVVLQKNTVMRVDRSLTTLKAGTSVEIVQRGDKLVTIRYKGQTGTIPIASLAAKGPVAATPNPAPTAPARASTTGTKSIVVDNPQSTYGNLVRKAEINAAKHDANLVKPADQVADDPPSK